MFIGPGQPTVPFDEVGVDLAPKEPGVYALCRADGTYIYFGETDNIRQRLADHLADTGGRIHRDGAAFFAFEIHPSPGGRQARRSQLVAAYAVGC